jgi:hypothetical protein
MPPVAPIFVPDLDTLKLRLRFDTAQGPSSVSDEILRSAIEYARARIVTRLGATGVSDIKATALSADPLTSEQIRRLQSVSLEVELVRLHLMETGFVFTQDSMPSSRTSMQDEGLPRRAAVSEHRQMIEDCRARIESLFESMEEAGQQSSGLSISSLGPEDPWYPGKSLDPTD